MARTAGRRIFLAANRRPHFLVDRSAVAVEAVKGLQAEGLHPVVLKGQAYARSYPKPELRQCGDIDIYVGRSHYRDAYMASVELGWKSHEDFKPDAKHYGCELHGVKIELHGQAGILMPASVNRKFQEWSHAQLSSSHRSVLVDGGTCRFHLPYSMWSLYSSTFIFIL